LIEAIRKLGERLIVAEPHAKPAPFMGPVIDNDAADELERAFAALGNAGGKIIKPLERLTPGLPFLSPAIIDVTEIENRPDEELFGPILQVIRVADFDAAIAEANATRYGLAASLIGGSPKQFEHYWTKARAGVVNWNKPTNGAPSNAPFGGIGLSGNHRPSAYYAADYCAYPVTSVTASQARGSIANGLRDPYAANMIES
jgi:succinylglutamic semialdehyde dehydrogenase